MSARRREFERAAAQVIHEAVRDVLLSDEPVRINTHHMPGPVLRWLVNQAQHVHTTTGQCIMRRDAQQCADEFDWWKPRKD